MFNGNVVVYGGCASGEEERTDFSTKFVMLSSQDDFDDDLELQESTESKHSSKSNTGTSNSGSTTSNEDYGVPPEVL